MSVLNLRVHKHVDADERGGPPPSVLANIYAIDASTGRRVRGGEARRQLVPISSEPGEHASVNVPAGQYMVEIALPTGELLTDQVKAIEENPTSVVLEAEDSSNEWMGWQHLSGNVLNAPAMVAKMASAAAPSPMPPPPESAGGRSAKARRRESGRMGRKDGARSVGEYAMTAGSDAAAAPEAEPRAPFVVPQALEWLRTPVPALLPDQPGDPWKELVALASLPAGEVVPRLNGGHSPVSIPVTMSAEGRALFRVVHGNQGVSRAVPLNSGLKRDFIAVPLGPFVEVISVPAPWLAYTNWREAMIEIAVQAPAEPRDFASAVTVRDDRLGVLLGFLSTGALSVVREMLEPAKEMLYYKMENPLAAAAGGYALIGTATDNKEHEWHGWIENLCKRFEHVPDGAIQLGMLRLRLRRKPSDLEMARDCLKQAYRRGLPYYAIGFRWLLEGLEKLCGDDKEMNEMRENVQRVALRSHPQSPFTILRFGDG